MKKIALLSILISIFAVPLFSQHLSQTDIMNKFYRTDPPSIVKGEITGADVFHAYGENTSVGSSLEDINNSNATLLYPTTYHRVKIVSTSANDATGGTGVRKVTVYGLDSTWTPISTVLTMKGTDSVSSAASIKFIRVFRIEADSVGSVGVSVGVIKLVTKESDTLLAQINAATNQSLQAHYTIPAGKYGYIGLFHATTNVQNKSNEVYLYARKDGKPWLAMFAIQIYGTSHSADFVIPYEFEPKTDIEIRALTSNGSGSIAAGFSGWYSP